MNTTVNGHARTEILANLTRKRARRKALTITSTQVSNLGKYLTIAMGASVPLLSLSLSSLGGSLLAGGAWSLGLVALLLCVCVLGVSLSHLAWAIGDITKSPAWANWALAIATDTTLVVGELAGVFAADIDVYFLRLGLMVAVTVASQMLNVWAFLAHRPTAARAK
jgi:hypothetical protein